MRIDVAAMGGIEQHEAAPLGGLQDLERGIELVFEFSHDRLLALIDLGERGPSLALLGINYRWKRAIVHGSKGRSTEILRRVHPLFTRHPAYGMSRRSGGRASPGSRDGREMAKILL